MSIKSRFTDMGQHAMEALHGPAHDETAAPARPEGGSGASSKTQNIAGDILTSSTASLDEKKRIADAIGGKVGDGSFSNQLPLLSAKIDSRICHQIEEVSRLEESLSTKVEKRQRKPRKPKDPESQNDGHLKSLMERAAHRLQDSVLHRSSTPEQSPAQRRSLSPPMQGRQPAAASPMSGGPKPPTM